MNRRVHLTEGSKCGFTLLELLIVVAIIVILLGALIPAVTSLSKSSGRKDAIANVASVIEQAHAQAIKDGVATYVVFPDVLPAGANTAMSQRYCYRSYAIFEDDQANPGKQRQLTPWQTLPTGLSLRSGSVGYLAKTISFPFSPLGGSTTASFPFLKFNSNGEVDSSSTPSSTTGTIQFGVFEGFVDSNGQERFTSSSQFTDTIAVYRMTGRAERM